MSDIAIAAATARKKSRAERFASLDGIRALSILLVLVGHLNGTVHFGSHASYIGDYAHLGVVVFFVVSGFLITSLLIAEQAKNGRVSLKLFYARRSLRIFPACYAYIACMAVLWLLGVIQLSGRSVWQAVTYTMNYFPQRPWQLGHLWSLSVEEQFYLLWPSVIVLLGLRKSAWVAAWVIVLAPFARVAGTLYFRGTSFEGAEMFPMVADSLAAGCLLAMTRDWLEGQRWYVALFRPGWSAGLLVLVFVINRYRDYTIVEGLGTSAINVVLAVLIHRSVYQSGDRMGQVLNWKPLAWIGILSYELYLWQQPFLNRNSTALVNTFPLNLVLVVVMAFASYRLFETPLLELRRRLRA